MNKKFLLLFSLVFISFPLTAQACPPLGDSQSLAYSQRDNNRCEGLRDRPVSGGPLRLVSFQTTSLSRYPQNGTLNIRVPRLPAGIQPEITVESGSRNYLLNNVNLNQTRREYIFPLDITKVLQAVGIQFRDLFGLAHIVQDSERVYLPLIFHRASDRYQFVIYSPQRTTFPVLQVRSSSGDLELNQPIDIPKKGYIDFYWQFGNASAGLYELRIETSNGSRMRRYFEHNPSWLP